MLEYFIMDTVFENIYRKNYQKLYTLAFRMTGSREDSEDILQSSFMNAYRAFPSFRNQSSVYTWLYRIVMNTSKKYFREERRLPIDEYAENNSIDIEEAYNYINSYGKVEDEVLVNLTRESCLQMFMNCMPSRYRSVYTLRMMLELTVKETSEILEISESAVKTNLHRAKKAARDHMEGRCSLIQPGAVCDCRSFAAYIEKTGKTDKLCSIEVVRNRERRAVEKFRSEINLIARINSLYNNQIKAPGYESFIERMKELAECEEITLIEKK